MTIKRDINNTQGIYVYAINLLRNLPKSRVSIVYHQNHNIKQKYFLHDIIIIEKNHQLSTK